MPPGPQSTAEMGVPTTTTARTSVRLRPQFRNFFDSELSRSCIDRVLAACLLVISLPLLLVAAAIVRLTSRGPAVYWQTRTGKNGLPFTIFKLRTMYHLAENRSGPRWATSGDTRITPFGRFMRNSHLDELPQLWNVVRGEMSLVGPRPERPEFVHQLAEILPSYRDRLRVRPGITGLAQLQLPPDSDLESVRKKLACDLVYIGCRGWWLDFRLLIATPLYLVGCKPHALVRLFALPKVDRNFVLRFVQTNKAALANTGTFAVPGLSSANTVLGPQFAIDTASFRANSSAS